MAGVQAAVLCVALFVACTLIGGAKDGTPHKLGKYVAKLKGEKFDHLLKQADRPSLLVEFFAPWCGACRNFAPTYARAGELARQRGLALKVAAVDCDAEAALAERFHVTQYPTVMLLSKHAKQPIRHEGIPRSAESLLDWVDQNIGEVIVSVDTESMVPSPEIGLRPVVVIFAPAVPEDLRGLAEAARRDAQWFHVLRFAGDVSVEIRHFAEDPISRLWPVRRPQAEEEEWQKERDLFISFYLTHRYPRFMPVHNPGGFVKAATDDTRDEFGLIWVLLNTSTKPDAPDEAPAGGSCSAASPDAESGSCAAVSSGADAAATRGFEEALEEAVKPWRRIFSTAAKLLGDKEASKLKNKFRIAYVDAVRHAAWAEHKLYAWDLPKVVMQRTIGFGSLYFFDEGRRMPDSPDELLKFVRDADTRLNVSARRKSQRPPAMDASAPFQNVVADNVEEALRSVPGTALYVYKGVDRDTMVSTDDEQVLVHDDEMEALGDLSAILRRTCAQPPAVMAIDARRNDIPIGLYSAAEFGMLSLPGLFFVPSDSNKSKFGGHWGEPILRYEPPKIEGEEPGDDTMKSLRGQLRVLSVDLQKATRWVLRQAAGVPGLSTPDDAATLLLGDSDAVARGPPVATLTENGFSRFTSDHPTAFIEFYAPWCGHCKRFAPTFEAAARSARRAGGVLADVAFAKIDGTEAKSLVAKYKIESYPTLVFSSNGSLRPYTGGQKKSDLLRWLEVEMTPTVRHIGAQEAARVTQGVIFRGALLSGDAWEAFGEVAEHYRQTLQFLAVEDVEAAEPMLTLRRPDRPDVLYEGDLDADAVIWWLAAETVRSEPAPAEETQTGVVRRLVGRTFAEEVFTASHAIVEVYAEWCSHCRDLAPVYEAFAQKVRSQNLDLVVAKIDGDKNGIPYDGFEREGYPTIFYVAPGSYAPVKVKARTLETLWEFVQRRQIPRRKPAQAKAAKEASELLDAFASEPIPASQAPGAVRQVVFRSFIQEVFRDDKNTILKVYSPTCPHCLAVAPQYDALAARLQRERPGEYVVAKIDATKNDLPFDGFSVKGYPTLFYIKAGEKAPSQEFVGSMIVQQVAAFLSLNLED